MADVNDRKSCCKVKTGALIYGIINAVASGLAILAFVVFMIYIGIEMGDIYREKPLLPSRATPNEMALELIHFAIFSIVSLIGFLFAVLLIVGITKKKPAFVLTYFIFGVLTTGISLAVNIAMQIAFFDGVIFGVWFAVTIIYALPLVLVFMTFKKIKSAVMYQPNYDPLQT